MVLNFVTKFQNVDIFVKFWTCRLLAGCSDTLAMACTNIIIVLVVNIVLAAGICGVFQSTKGHGNIAVGPDHDIMIFSTLDKLWFGKF